MNICSKVCGRGFPILTIHGIISDHSFFDGIIQYLSQQYTMISYDRRGYGQSTSDKIDTYSVSEQVMDAYHVLRRYTDSPAYIVAHSAGSVIALELAICYPKLVKGLILVEPAFGLASESAESLKEWNHKLNDYAENRKPSKAFSAFFELAGVDSNKKMNTISRAGNMARIKMVMKNLETLCTVN